METTLIVIFTLALGAIIGSVIESKHNKKLAMKAWKEERQKHYEERYK